MTRAGIPTQKIESMWKAYKKHQTAFYVACTCKISPHTAKRYIERGDFAVRFAKLKVKASEIADDAQADVLAQDLIKLSNIKTLVANSIMTALEKRKLSPSITELDKIIRLIAFIRGEPDSRTEEIHDFSWLDEDPDSETEPQPTAKEEEDEV